MAQEITPELVEAAFQNFDTRFRAGIKMGAPWWSLVATLLTSDTEEEVHSWLQLVPGLAEWVTERNTSSAALSAYRLKNRDFNRDVKVPRNKLADDKLGVFGPIFEQLGMHAAKFGDRRIARLMKIGHDAAQPEAICFDGKPFYAADHPIDPNRPGAGTFENYLTGKTLTKANFEEVLVRMSEFTMEDGEPLGLMATDLTVPMALRATALEVVEAAIVQSASTNAGVTNVNQGVVRVKVLPELSGTASDKKSWYVSVCDQPIKPFIFQLREAIKLAILFGLDSEHCKKTQEIVFGAEGRAAFGYSFPQLSFKCVGS